MRRRRFLSGLALAGLFGFLHLITGCAQTVQFVDFTYDVPRPGGGVDEVSVVREIFQRDDGSFGDQIERLTVNGTRIYPADPQYRRYLSMLYLPAVTQQTGFEGAENYLLQQLGDPSGIRPKGSPNPPISDPTLGTRPKS
jgi:hypothetical protein